MQIYKNSSNLNLAVIRDINNQNDEGIVFLHGYMSDKSGTKAQFIREKCKENNQNFLSFDLTGHGESQGEIKNCSMEEWLKDATEVIKFYTKKPQIVIGSSLGGWLAFLLAIKEKELVKSIIGIAPALDFTKELKASINKATKEGDLYLFAEPNGNISKIYHKLIFNSDNLLILDKKEMSNVTCPCFIMHGEHDCVVPIGLSLKTLEKIGSEKAILQIIKNGDHRLSNEENLKELEANILKLI